MTQQKINKANVILYLGLEVRTSLTHAFLCLAHFSKKIKARCDGGASPSFPGRSQLASPPNINQSPALQVHCVWAPNFGENNTTD